MLTGLLNRLRGQVRLRVVSDFPERVLNLCSARGLSFWDLEWESPTAFRCRMRREDWHELRQAAEKLDCTLTVLGRQGTPYFLERLRQRPVLAVALAVWGMALFLGSFFIWQFEVTGNRTVPEEKILRALEHCGVRRGVFGLTLDRADIRNHVLLDVPELLWIQVNVSGCRAWVEVRERKNWPELVDRETPSNVLARRPGLVLEVHAGDGVGAVLPGTVVEEGELLISGVEDTGTVGARVLAGRGRVLARTWYTLTAAAPLEIQEKRHTGRVEHRAALVFGTRRVNFFANSSMEGGNCDKIANRHPLSLFGIPLPVTLVTETYRPYERTLVRRDAAAAEQEMERILRRYLTDLVTPYGTVRSALVSSRLRGDALAVTLTAECREEIGVRVPLYHEEKTDGTVRNMQE